MNNFIIQKCLINWEKIDILVEEEKSKLFKHSKEEMNKIKKFMILLLDLLKSSFDVQEILTKTRIL
jgi:hypothetical protein